MAKLPIAKRFLTPTTAHPKISTMPKTWAMAWITLILLAAAVLRLPRLADFPPGLHYDEAANAILSGDIGLRGDRPVFIESYTGKEVLFFYGAGALMRAVGESVFALRLTSAFFGLLTIATAYRLGILIFRDSRVGLLAALIITFSFQHLLFSRLGFRAISQPLLQGLTVWFLIEGMRRLEQEDKAWWWLWLWGGLMLGLTAYTYLAARLFPIALLLGLGPAFFLAMMRPTLRWRMLQGVGLALVTGLAALGPLLVYFIEHPDAFWVRISQVGSVDTAPIPVAEGLRRVGLMLFVPGQGDPYIRFNIPGLPLFGPLLAIFTFIGFGLILRNLFFNIDHQRGAHPRLHPSAFILLCSPLVMLLPSALATSEIVPSNLRAIGILPFVAFWPAVGIVVAWDYLQIQLVKAMNRGAVLYFPVLLTALLIVQGGLTTRAYFLTWGGRADLIQENDGDLVALAEGLENGQVPEQRQFVSTRFNPHPTLAFTTEDYERLTLLPRSETLVFPDSAQGRDHTIYFPAGSPKASWMDRFLAKPSVQDRYFESYAIDSQVQLNPSVSTETQFGFAVEMLGYDLVATDPDERDEVLIRLYWRVLGSPGFDMTPFVHLEDPRGGRWGQREVVGFSAADWQVGDRFVQQIAVPVTPGTPPGLDYRLRIGWFDPATGNGVARFSPSGLFAGTALIIDGINIGPTRVDGREQVPEELLRADIRPGLHLLGYEKGKRDLTNGEPLWVSLWWEAEQPLPEMLIRFELRQGRDGVILSNTQPVYNRYPFTRWPDSLFLIDQHAPEIPLGQPSGAYELHIRVLAADNSTLYTTSLGEVIVSESDIRFEPPEIDIPTEARFGGEIDLYGYTLEHLEHIEENRYLLDLTWRAETRPAATYTAFVHLLDLDGACCVWQEDRPIGSQLRPSSIWLAGEYVTDRFEITLPDLVEDGATYPLEIGLYLPESGQRLTVVSPLPGGEDYIFLSPLEIP